ncbi:hypothetical protein [Georgenia sp. MJ170]|uniref:hypothetical protein n=1 Tax=Georgenia sunbinii TaxID=3117728 RepID=UPI002F264D9E
MGTGTQIAARSALLATDEGSTIKELAAGAGLSHGATWPGTDGYADGPSQEEFL